MRDETQMEGIGQEFLNILEERGAPKLKNESFENAVKSHRSPSCRRSSGRSRQPSTTP